MNTSTYEDRGKRTDGPCPACGRSRSRVFFPNGTEKCFGCSDYKKGENTKRKSSLNLPTKRNQLRKSRKALKDFFNLKAAKKSAYLISHRHKGDTSLRIVSDLRQDGEKLVVPMYDRQGQLRNLQYIHPDGRKRVLHGISTKGLFHPIGDSSTRRIWITEGYATGVTMNVATGDDVLVAFGCGNLLAVAEHAKSLGKHVRICGDTKEALIAEEVAAAVGGDLFIPQFPDGVTGTDANDLAHALGIKRLWRQIEKNTQAIPPKPDVIDLAVKLSLKDYRQFLKDLAITDDDTSVRAFDKEVQERRQTITFEEPVLWPEPVDGIELVQDIKTSIIEHVSLSDNSATAISLWTLMTYLLDGRIFRIAPYLAVLSPVWQCGKTTLLEILEQLVLRPQQTSSITTAPLFRITDEYQPTLLIDEFDSFRDMNPETRGVLNAGHKRGANVIRCVGDDNTARKFSTFGAKVIAMIARKAGDFPGSLEDRSIVIPMSRKLATDKKRRLGRPEQGDTFDVLRRKISRWAQDNEEAIGEIDIEDIEGLSDRANDNWRPLLQIANRIGGEDYQNTITAVALKIAEQKIGQEDNGVLLLKDFRDLFYPQKGNEQTQLATAFILDALIKMDDRPWPEFKDGKPITSRQVAELLKPYEIEPKVYHISGTEKKKARGYVVEDFRKSFERYCK